jgi:nucleotide-binding universal stress UspA family protein
MATSGPKHIICAVRGRPESRDTVTYAIDLALEIGAKLTFFHVLTVEFVEHALVSPLSVIYRELHDMSEFMMMILHDRAQRRGVKDVASVVREGDFRKQLRQFVVEAGADILIVGAPTRSPGRNIFTRAQIEAFVAELEEAATIEVILVEPSDERRA